MPSVSVRGSFHRSYRPQPASWSGRRHGVDWVRPAGRGGRGRGLPSLRGQFSFSGITACWSAEPSHVGRPLAAERRCSAGKSRHLGVEELVRVASAVVELDHLLERRLTPVVHVRRRVAEQVPERRRLERPMRSGFLWPRAGARTGRGRRPGSARPSSRRRRGCELVVGLKFSPTWAAVAPSLAKNTARRWPAAPANWPTVRRRPRVQLQGRQGGAVLPAIASLRTVSKSFAVISNLPAPDSSTRGPLATSARSATEFPERTVPLVGRDRLGCCVARGRGAEDRLEQSGVLRLQSEPLDGGVHALPSPPNISIGFWTGPWPAPRARRRGRPRTGAGCRPCSRPSARSGRRASVNPLDTRSWSVKPRLGWWHDAQGPTRCSTACCQVELLSELPLGDGDRVLGRDGRRLRQPERDLVVTAFRVTLAPVAGLDGLLLRFVPERRQLSHAWRSGVDVTNVIGCRAANGVMIASFGRSHSRSSLTAAVESAACRDAASRPAAPIRQHGL